MTRLSTHEQIVVMQAFVDGKEIEVEIQGGDTWRTVADRPRWDWYTFNYRIKAAPKEVWLVYTGQGAFVHCFSEKGNAEDYVNCISLRREYTIHKMVEDKSCVT